MSVNPIAQELNAIIKNGNPHLMEMLSKTGRRLFFPKGILTQSAEAREKADPKFNATIGIATEHLDTMYLPSVMGYINREEIKARECLTYAPSYGLPELRHLWREFICEKNPSLAGKTISLPIVTNGITHGISIFADMFLDPDDVVIFPDKMWGNNHLVMAVRRDAVISNYPMFNDRGGFNLDAFEKRVRMEADNNYKVVVFLNFPNNPTGYTINEAEADRIVDILTDIAEGGTNIIAVTDDAYFGLRYEDEPISESLFARLCDRHSRLLAVKLDGATKEMFVWGLRVGFITYGTKVMHGEAVSLYEALEKKTAGGVRGSISSASHIGQRLVLKALGSPEFRRERDAKVMILKRRANLVKRLLAGTKYNDAWDVYPFNSGYFMCLRLKTVEAEALRLHLLNQYRVGTIATGKHDLRIAFSSVDEENLEALFDAIYRGAKDLAR
ncbi:aminotransferase class I/II-fold pyridoxal phosphate-dependent enzyme [Desulfococcus sp.]|uniref:aminotransferase class I/II-fold pyridoxal phosphate-dependent enzyme n=1 Tax=Desulfococcus sp. TaxID=2025834 RepID=UPI0035936370